MVAVAFELFTIVTGKVLAGEFTVPLAGAVIPAGRGVTTAQE